MKPGEFVIYIPYQADGDASHPDCETGVVTSINFDGAIFVRFGIQIGSQGCMAEQLVSLTDELNQASRERQQLRAENLRLRDKVLEFAAACSRCDGTGLQTDYVDERGLFIEEGDPDRATRRAVTSDCEDCADIRAALK